MLHLRSRSAAVFDDHRMEPFLNGVPCGGVDADIRLHSREEDVIDSLSLQDELQLRVGEG